mgnify:FL=1
MNDSKFPKLLDYQALKQQYGDEADLPIDSSSQNTSQENNALNFEQERAEKKLGLHGSRLRSYAFAVLTRKEYSKVELIEKLALYAESRDEVISLVEELSAQHYQSDQRVAEMMLSSQKRKGKGPNQIKIKLKNKKVDSALIAEELKETDWAEQAYQLKVKKYGLDVTKDQKLKAKQMRFLMYRGFEMDAIIKAISRKPNED